MKENIRIFLHKPNREIIGELSHFHNAEHELDFGQIHKLTFSIPYLIEIDNYVNDEYVEKENVENPHFHAIKEKYLLRIESFHSNDWYIIDKIRRVGNETTKEKQVTALLLPYELKGKKLFDWAGVLIDGEYRKEGLTLRQISENVVSGTSWYIRHIDSTLENKYRGFDFNDSDDGLTAIFKIAETFKAVPLFDTDEQAIDFKDFEMYGEDLGFFVSYGRLLRGINDEVDSSEIYTKMIPIGKDGIRINEKNPTGAEFLMDYSYYIYPFERDENRNVIRSSDYMSDELCHALLDYQELVESKNAEYQGLIGQQDNLYLSLATKYAEANDIELELAQVREVIDAKQANEQDASEELQQEEQLQAQLDALNAEIDTILNDLENLRNQIKEITSLLKLENNFSESLLQELSRFDNTYIWENDNIVDVNDLLESAKKEFETLNIPSDKTEIDLVDLIEIVKHDQDVPKDILNQIRLGCRFTLHYEQFNKKITTQIVKLNINYNLGSIRITAANTVDLARDEEDKVSQMILGAVRSANNYNRNKSNIEEISQLKGEMNRFLKEGLDAARQRIVAGANQNVIIDNRGITVIDIGRPERFLRIMNGVIGMSTDGGKTLDLAIDPSGVYAERLVGRILIGESLFIEDEDGTLTIKGNLMTVKDRNARTRVLLGEHEPNKFGLKLYDKSGQFVVLDEEGILQTWQEGRADNVDANNGLSVHVFIPEETLEIKKAILRFKLLPFRTYGKTTTAGGSTSVTSSNGGGTTATSSSGGGTTATSSAGGGVNKSTASGGSSSPTSSSGGGTSRSTASGGGTTQTSAPPSSWQYSVIWTDQNESTAPQHNHRINQQYLYHIHNISLPSHTHSFTVPDHTHTVSIPSHSHDFEVPNHTHSVSISNHTHTVSIPNHTHTVNIPAHTHEIDFGIYTSTTATNVGIIINGIDRTNALGGRFTSDRDNIDITQYIEVGKWNEIVLTSSRLGRIDTSVFIQARISNL